MTDLYYLTFLDTLPVKLKVIAVSEGNVKLHSSVCGAVDDANGF